jgi:hypothetical protein
VRREGVKRGTPSGGKEGSYVEVDDFHRLRSPPVMNFWLQIHTYTINCYFDDRSSQCMQAYRAYLEALGLEKLAKLQADALGRSRDHSDWHIRI